MNKRTLSGYFPLVLLGLLLGGCSESAPPTQARAESSPVVRAKVQTVQTRNLPAYATFPGSVEPADQVQVASRLTGNVRSLYVHEGELVKKGQPLLAIDPTGVKAQIDQAGAALKKADAALTDARENYRRFGDLYRQQAIPKQQFEKIEMAYRVAQGDRAAAQAALAGARSQLAYAEVRAPFAGVVVAKAVDAGQLATPGRPLLTLQGNRHLQVQTQVNARAYAQLKLGQSLSVVLDGIDGTRRVVSGTVERLVGAADPQTHTHLLKIGLAEASGATSGEFARVKVPLGSRPGILVPDSAIQRRAGTEGVFVVDGDGLAHFRMLRLGARAGDGRVVLAGLVDGERIAVSHAGALFNGARVQADNDGN